jgi:two-component sensor histidine kinase/sensor domain CHASE-containing protein
MSLRKHILLILFIVIALSIGFDYAIQRMIVFSSFVSLEQSEAKKDMDRCVQAIHREIHHLDLICHDWAAWDDTYEFVVDKNKNYIESNLNDESYKINNVNMIYVVNKDGKVVWDKIIDFETDEAIKIQDFEVNFEEHPLIEFNAEDNSIKEVVVKGIYTTERGPMLIASRPILTSENKGPVRGALIMGRFLNENVISTLKEQTRVDFQIWSITRDSIPEKDKLLLDHLTVKNPFQIRDHDEKLLNAYTLFSDIRGVPTLLIRADIPRDITARGYTALRFAVVSIIAAGVIVLLVLLFLLQRTIVGPISILTKHTQTISKQGDLSKHIQLQRNDEIGKLAASFNEMTDELKETIISLDQEIAERKFVGNELIKHRDHLEELVNEQTEELTKTNEQLKRSLEEKEILLREIYHRTKNNMEVICSLLSLQSSHIGNKQVEQVLNETQNRIRSMSLAHENLYQALNLSNINLKDYIKDLSTNLLKNCKTTENRVSLKFDSDDINISIDTAVPYGLVMNELLSNSLKHAFSDNRKGEIRIAQHLMPDGSIELVFGDNGIGVPKDCDLLRNKSTLGMQLVVGLVENQLKGKVEKTETKGTEFKISFKPKQQTRV